jgi:hypothetical protein
MNIEQIIRTAEVRRWQIVRLAVDQSVGEHVYCVVQIARELYRALHISPFCRNWGEKDLVYAATFHDIEEGLTGDIPSPTKRAAQQMGFDWNDAIHQLVPEQNFALREIEDIIKAADLLDAWRFVQTYRISPHGLVVRDRLHQKLLDYAMQMHREPRWSELGVSWPQAISKVMSALTQPVLELTDARVLGSDDVPESPGGVQEAVSEGVG